MSAWKSAMAKTGSRVRAKTSAGPRVITRARAKARIRVRVRAKTYGTPNTTKI